MMGRQRWFTVAALSDQSHFVFSPAADHTPIGPDLGFTIQLSDIPVSRKVGTAPITLTESSRTGTSAFQDRATVFSIGKFPADFYLRNFQCEPLIIPNGGDVTLTWERSANATYELLYPGVERDVTDRTSLELEGIKSDTTFYLRATTGDPTNPVTRILSTQVTVLKPDLDIGNLTVHGSLNAVGSATRLYHYGYQGPGHEFFNTTEVGWTAHSSAGFAIVNIGGVTGSEFRFLLDSETVKTAGDMQRPGGGYSGHSATLPVKCGEKFSFRMLMTGTPVPYSTEVYWVPLSLVTTPPTQDYIKHE
ncbi:hypothetical protein [Streptomyces sp. NPDC058674]|uniref:hypothetical protein n=1 Tax=Streptomyces sp. NPDC058674 TaxID=3346592 RepID=UPI003651415C